MTGQFWRFETIPKHPQNWSTNSVMSISMYTYIQIYIYIQYWNHFHVYIKLFMYDECITMFWMDMHWVFWGFLRVLPQAHRLTTQCMNKNPQHTMNTYVCICMYMIPTIKCWLYLIIWLVLWNICYCSIQLGIVTPTDELIFFQRGRLKHQPVMFFLLKGIWGQSICQISCWMDGATDANRCMCSTILIKEYADLPSHK